MIYRTIIRNMTNISISKKPPIPVFGIEGRYVSALYSAASQKNELDQVEKHFRDLQNELVKPKILDFIETSMIPSAAKAKLLKEVASEAGMPDTAKNFLELVAENGRLKMLRRIITMFLNVMVAHRNQALCEVVTATPLDDTSRKSLMEALKQFIKEKKQIKMTEKVDPSILGGMIVGIEDKHIDLSIARKIQKYSDILQQSI